MMRTSKPEEEDEDKKIKAYRMEEGVFVSIAEEAARLCRVEREEGSKGDRKYRKREAQATIKRRFYHVRKEVEDTVHSELKMKLTSTSLPKTPNSGLLSHYHIHCDPDLGVNRQALRRIPCACATCEERKKMQWFPGVDAKDQPRFQQNKECKYWPIFSGGYNGWKIVETVSRPNNDPFDISAVKQEVLSGIATRMAEAIFENGFGAIMTEDKQAHGYYLVEWCGLPYTLQEDSDEIQAGDLVCEATYLNQVERAPYWYTPSDMTTVVRLQHVVGADLEMNQPSASIKLPSNCKHKDAVRKGARRLSVYSHELLLDEINRRDALDYEEEDKEESTDEEDELTENNVNDSSSEPEL